MARKISELPPAIQPRTSLYPWDQWFDGDVWELTRGEDFTLPTAANFRCMVGENARKRGIKARTRLVGETVYVQAQV